MRNIQFVNGEFYHIYNRGVDKRNIYSNKNDVARFLRCMKEFNTLDPIGSLYQNSFGKTQTKRKHIRLVNIICYCIMPNHFHFVLEQVADKGIEKFMHKLGTGHTRYFNDRYKRSGALFQGSYKAIHINSNEYLLHLSAYVNLNHRVHQLSSLATKLVKSSWGEYINKTRKEACLCKKEIILRQFKNEEYKNFVENSVRNIIKNKKLHKEISHIFIE